MTRTRTVTGIKPTGIPHLGNYYGMFRPALDMAPSHDAFYFVADYHALTTSRDPDQLRRRSTNVAAHWIALGLDPERSVLYRQSDVPEVCELSWLLACCTAKGLLNRAHAYKAAVQANDFAGRDPDHGVNAGLFYYPILMAADILGHRADVVPVGRDNVQHLEMARDIAAAFNSVYGDVLTLPAAFVDERAMTVPGTDGRRMSKSYDNVVPILAALEDIRRRVMSIVTDSRRPDEPKDPEQCAVFALYRHVAAPADVATMAERYRAGAVGYKEAKGALADVVIETFADARAHHADLLADPPRLDAILTAGADRARASFRDTLATVRSAAGLRT